MLVVFSTRKLGLRVMCSAIVLGLRVVNGAIVLVMRLVCEFLSLTSMFKTFVHSF